MRRVKSPITSRCSKNNRQFPGVGRSAFVGAPCTPVDWASVAPPLDPARACLGRARGKDRAGGAYKAAGALLLRAPALTDGSEVVLTAGAVRRGALGNFGRAFAGDPDRTVLYGQFGVLTVGFQLPVRF